MLKCVFKALQLGGLFILIEINRVKQLVHSTLSDNKKPCFTVFTWGLVVVKVEKKKAVNLMIWDHLLCDLGQVI